MNKSSHKICNIGPIIMKITQNLAFDMLFKFQSRKTKIYLVSADVSKAKKGSFSPLYHRKLPFFNHIVHVNADFCTF